MNKNNIFRKGSTTYYFSSIFFPKKVRDDVFTLYAFVRTADDFVDQTPADSNGFLNFKKMTMSSMAGGKSGNEIIDDFILLARENNFNSEWVVDFLESMESDLHIKSYKTFSDLEKYIYGSADVIGLMMARIMNLKEESFDAARLLGKSMQIINFVRDIKEDLELGRVYMPQNEIAEFNLSPDLSDIVEKQSDFKKLVNFQIDRYMNIVGKAEKGFSYIPPRLRASIMTANDMYKWTADRKSVV